MRKILLLFMLALSLSVFASDVLVVKQNDATTSWTISTISQITFDGKGVNIAFNDGQSIYYPSENLNMLQFNITPSGVNNIEAQNAISLMGNTIVVSTPVECIKVYSVSGALVAHAAGQSLDISQLGQGTYIVQAGSIISKIVKQ